MRVGAPRARGPDEGCFHVVAVALVERDVVLHYLAALVSLKAGTTISLPSPTVLVEGRGLVLGWWAFISLTHRRRPLPSPLIQFVVDQER